MGVLDSQAVKEQRLLLQMQQQEIQVQRRIIMEQRTRHEQRRQEFEAQIHLLKIKQNLIKHR